MPIYKMDGKKDGLQKYRVRVNYIDDSGIARQTEKVAYGFEDAKVLEFKMTQNIKNDSLSQKKTFKELSEEYLQNKQYEVRETTIDKTEATLNHHILPFFGNMKLDKIDVSSVQKWKVQIESKGFELKTKQNAFSMLRVILNYAIKMEYINKNPLARAGNFKSAYTVKKEMNYYTADEFKKFKEELLKYAEANGGKAWDYYVFFCIAFYTGLRKGEIHALKWSDITGNYLNVKRSITQKLKGEDRETPPKNKSSIRTLQIPMPLLEALEDHKRRYKKTNGFSNDLRISGGEKPLRDTSIQNVNKRISTAAQVKTIRIHDFRHSHVSLLANEGINIQEISRRLGHANIEMTWNTYSHLYPREEERAIEILNKI